MKIYKILILLVLVLMIPFSFAAPVLPHAFYGNVTNNGSALETGCMICTSVNGNVIANDCITTDQVGTYGINRKLIAQNADSGDIVKFKIGPVYANETATYTSGNVDNLDLTFTNADCSKSTFGNGVIDGIEQCDGTDLGDATCVSLGYASGTLSCNTNLGIFNTTQCISADTNSTGSTGETTGGTTGETTEETTGTETTISYSSQNETPTVSQVQSILKDLNLSTNDLQQYVKSAQEGLLKVERKLEVKKIVSSTGTVSYKSTFSISVKNNSTKKLKDIKVVETIPKNIALDASKISSIYQFTVLEADPVLQFTIPSINIGETITIPYTVDKNVTKAEFEGMDKVVSKATVVETTGTTTGDGTTTGNTTTDNNGEITSDTGSTTLPPDYVRPKGIFSNTWSWIIIILLIAYLVFLFYRHKHLAK